MSMDTRLEAAGGSRLDFVRQLLRQVKEGWLRKAPILRGLKSRPMNVDRELPLRERFPFSVVEARKRLKESQLLRTNLIFCVGSPDAIPRERLLQQAAEANRQVTGHQIALAYWQPFRDAGIRPCAVLVVDVGGGDSDGRALASAMAALQQPGMLTLYWKPPGTR